MQTFRLMLEEEQRYVDSLRSELARCPGDEKKLVELTNAERNVATLQNQLQAIVGQNNATNEVWPTKQQTFIPRKQKIKKKYKLYKKNTSSYAER